MQANLDNYYIIVEKKLQRKCVNYFTANLDTALLLDIYFYMKLGPIKDGLIYIVNSRHIYVRPFFIGIYCV